MSQFPDLNPQPLNDADLRKIKNKLKWAMACRDAALRKMGELSLVEMSDAERKALLARFPDETWAPGPEHPETYGALRAMWKRQTGKDSYWNDEWGPEPDDREPQPMFPICRDEYAKFLGIIEAIYRRFPVLRGIAYKDL